MNTEELKNRIIEANKAYRLGNEIMTDQEFDDLCEEYQSLVTESEYSKFRDSLNEGMVEYGTKVKHMFVAGSLLKLKYEDPETVRDFLKKHVHNQLNISAKVDGLTGICHYKNGRLIGFATRGDGYEGVSILDKAKFIKFIPQKINSKEELFIRGELVILKEDYDKIEGTSPRNIVAGLINRKDCDTNELGNISFIAYTIMGRKYPKILQFDELTNLGFNVVWFNNYSKDEINSDDFIDNLFDIASLNFKYATDGLVLSDSDYCNEEEYKPKAQVAFKINQQKVETKLIGVEWAGPTKDGRHNCIGILQPVEIGGVTVSRCTIHNIDFINEHNLKIGDTVSICRSGDVIPKLLGVVCSSEESREIELPNVCNCCGSKLIQEGPFLYCTNEECPDRITYQVMHFIKKCGVEYASFKTLRNFNIVNFDDLISFSADKTYKSEVKFENELENKVFSLSKDEIFCKLNMRDIGETLLRKIVEFYRFENIENGSFESKTSSLPEGIGDITINKFISEYRKNLNVMNKITSDSRYKPLKRENKKMNTNENKGSVCFTGALNTMTRNEASRIAEENGYSVKSSVSKGLTYLVTNTPDSGSSKNKKAQQFGTKIITEEEFIEMMK